MVITTVNPYSVVLHGFLRRSTTSVAKLSALAEPSSAPNSQDLGQHAKPLSAWTLSSRTFKWRNGRCRQGVCFWCRQVLRDRLCGARVVWAAGQLQDMLFVLLSAFVVVSDRASISIHEDVSHVNHSLSQVLA